jgi:hypothetical protein
MDDSNNFSQNPPQTAGGMQTETPLTGNSIISVPVDIKSLTGWATFRAIIDIIAGASAAMSIIFAGYGIPMILAALKLLRYVDEVKLAVKTNDRQKLTDSVEYLQKYFKLSGIATIVSYAMGILLVIAYIIFIVYLLSNPDTFRDIFGNNDFFNSF